MWPVGLEGRGGAEQRAWGGEAGLGISRVAGHRTPGAGAPEREGHGRWEGSCPDHRKGRPVNAEWPWRDGWGVWEGGRWAGGSRRVAVRDPRAEGIGAGKGHQWCHMGVTS